jgi:hypothetical protein
MKKLSFIALATVMIVALGTGMAFADAFNVTSSFGVRVTEQGASERVGSITLAPSEVGTDAFTPAAAGPVPAQIITVELLGQATISRTFGADYDWDGLVPVAFDPTAAVVAAPVGDYRVIAIEGNDFFTISVTDTGVIPGPSQILVGHDDISALCFNLIGTVYNASDPARQLVQVSYSDGLSNTYSGDIYVATVKPKSVSIDMCGKVMPTETIQLDGALAQGEDCGLGSGSDCVFTFEDNAAGALTGDYLFTIGKTTGAKAGVGFEAIVIEFSVDDGATWNPVVGGTAVEERLNSDGDTIALADFDSDEEGYVATSQIVVSATLPGPGLYRIWADYQYDTCVITPGIWTIDVYASKDPCGGSWSQLDWDFVQFFNPEGSPVAYAFPYAAAGVGSWVNGIAFTNASPLSIAIDVTCVEADGDVYTGQVTVPAGQMAVGFVQALVNPTTTGSDAAFGDENYAIYASGNGTFYGFLFIANGNQAQGYLPIMTMHP